MSKLRSVNIDAEIRALIEKVSPPLYLELFGRCEPPSKAWTVYGNQLLSPAGQRVKSGTKSQSHPVS